MYDSFSLGTLKMFEGDQQKADYFLNCSVFEYYYRISNRNKFVEWHNNELKNKH